MKQHNQSQEAKSVFLFRREGERPRCNPVIFQKKINIYLKPSLLRGWYILRETAKCLVIAKRLPRPREREVDVGAYHLSKKIIRKIKWQ